MPIIYRIISSQDSALRQLGEDGWILSAISEGKMYLHKEEKKTRSKTLISWDWFDDWYKKYPNKKARSDAEKMWSRLDSKDRELACDGLERYLVYWKKKWIEKQFIPLPWTWIHQKRWEDDLSDTVFTPPKENIDKLKAEREEERRNEEEKNRLHERIRKIKSDPVEWGKLEELANSQLTEVQKESPVYRALLDARIKMIVSTYK